MYVVIRHLMPISLSFLTLSTNVVWHHTITPYVAYALQTGNELKWLQGLLLLRNYIKGKSRLKFTELVIINF